MQCSQFAFLCVYIYIYIHIYPSHFDFVGVVSVVSRWKVQVGWA